ncbi:phage tail protein [Derxia lacustris]|uniref:phage tail protein n=1 Tax=Derxia lacustris TaxID=764842 RepID=UPI000A172B27|nr:tail fiber protein [Derxia lacustris]
MSEPFIGEIRMVGFNYAPFGWAFCDGSLVPISQNNALFALLGTTFGGNAQTNFGLPDLRGRAPVGAALSGGISTPPANYLLGEQPGAENFTLTAAAVPLAPHTHGASVVVAEKATTATPSNTALIGGATDIDNQVTYANFAPTSPPVVPLAGNSVAVGQPVSTAPPAVAIPTVPPSLALNFIIALQGIFPSRG